MSLESLKKFILNNKKKISQEEDLGKTEEWKSKLGGGNSNRSNHNDEIETKISDLQSQIEKLEKEIEKEANSDDNSKNRQKLKLKF